MKWIVDESELDPTPLMSLFHYLANLYGWNYDDFFYICPYELLCALPGYISKLWKRGFIGHQEMMFFKAGMRLKGYKGYDQSSGVDITSLEQQWYRKQMQDDDEDEEEDNQESSAHEEMDEEDRLWEEMEKNLKPASFQTPSGRIPKTEKKP